jgi:hypothetical protein
MPPRYVLAATLLGLALMAFGNAGQAAGLGYSFDGRRIANVPPVRSCSPSRLTLDVRGGVIVGYVVNSEGSFAVGGEVDAAGRGTIRIGGWQAWSRSQAVDLLRTTPICDVGCDTLSVSEPVEISLSHVECARKSRAAPRDFRTVSIMAGLPLIAERTATPGGLPTDIFRAGRVLVTEGVGQELSSICPGLTGSGVTHQYASTVAGRNFFRCGVGRRDPASS